MMKEVKKHDRYENEWIKRTFKDHDEEIDWRETHCRVCEAEKTTKYYHDPYGEIAFNCSVCGAKTIIS